MSGSRPRWQQAVRAAFSRILAHFSALLYLAPYSFSHFSPLRGLSWQLLSAASQALVNKGIVETGAPLPRADLNNPFGITRGPEGCLYCCEFGGNVVRRIDAQRIITTVAGTGQPGFAGDSGPALQAQLNQPHEVQDSENHRLRAMTAD
jgi:hypothetical protein